MKKLIGCIVVCSLTIAGSTLLRARKSASPVSPAERLTLRDALNSASENDTAPNGALPTLPKLKISSAHDGSSTIRGIDADGQAYEHAPNTGDFIGVYMTRHESAAGFIDILAGRDGFCDGNRISVRTRVISKDGKPVVMGTCFEQPVNGVLRQSADGCGFSIHLMRHASTGQPLAYLTLDNGDCKSYGTGKADLTSIAGLGFWMLQ